MFHSSLWSYTMGLRNQPSVMEMKDCLKTQGTLGTESLPWGGIEMFSWSHKSPSRDQLGLNSKQQTEAVKTERGCWRTRAIFCTTLVCKSVLPPGFYTHSHCLILWAHSPQVRVPVIHISLPGTVPNWGIPSDLCLHPKDMDMSVQSQKGNELGKIKSRPEL